MLCDEPSVELSHDDSMMNEDQLSVPDYQYFAKICKEDRERVKKAYKELTEGNVSKIKEEYRVIVRKNGVARYEWVEAQATVDKRDEKGNPITLIGSSRDHRAKENGRRFDYGKRKSRRIQSS